MNRVHIFYSDTFLEKWSITEHMELPERTPIHLQFPKIIFK